MRKVRRSLQGVPLNEEGKPDFSATIRMPELKIPKSMINVDPENASSSAEIPDASGIFGNIEDIAASVGTGPRRIKIRTSTWRILFWQQLHSRESISRRKRNLRMSSSPT